MLGDFIDEGVDCGVCTETKSQIRREKFSVSASSRYYFIHGCSLPYKNRDNCIIRFKSYDGDIYMSYDGAKCGRM